MKTFNYDLTESSMREISLLNIEATIKCLTRNLIDLQTIIFIN